MANTEMSGATPAGLESLHHLKSIDPPQWLAPSPELSKKAREASQYIFSSLKPYTPKSPFDNLLVENFDAEQIWQQIDLQTQSLLTSLARDVNRFEKNPEELLKVFGANKVLANDKEVKGSVEEGDDEFEDIDEGEDEDEDGDEGSEEEGEDEGDEDEDDVEEDEKGRKNGDGGVEDEFLKFSEMGEYLDDEEEKEYGLKTKRSKKKGGVMESSEEEEGDGDEDEDEDEEDDDELGLDNGDDEENLGMSTYEDFFGGKNKKDVKRRSELIDGSEDSETDDEQENDDTLKSQKKGPLSTHEKELLKRKAEIEKMEQENMDKNTWTMQGEITASKRPMNSALEADLDFEHNMRPAPVITEDVTASIEELIQKRILEGHFDDVKAPSLSYKAPREHKELDENKSKKGLAEIYEEEYTHTTNPESAPLTFSDERKKEATMLFKQLCLKLDALSHFHFAPKPVIDDMSIRTNVPALAMEEIAPVAVSDAAMLAPEEVFSGKGDIKEDAELTQAERKMRRSNKKRKFKAETAKKTLIKKSRESAALNGKEADS